jgi:hypothetical protein
MKGGEIIVCCNQHGAMTWDERMKWWICRGWAGEGCLTGMIATQREVMKAAYGEAVPPGVRVTLRQNG